MERPQDPLENTAGDDQQMVSGVESKMVSKFDKFNLSDDKEVSMTLETASQSTKQPLYRRPWFLVLTSIILLLIIIFTWLGIVGYQTYQKGIVAAGHAEAAAAAFESRDLGLAKTELTAAGDALKKAHQTYDAAKPLSYIPLLGAYVRDGDHGLSAGELGVETGHLVFTALEPYADVLGFAGAETSLEFESAEDRVIFLATTVEKLAPQMNDISAKLKEMDSHLQQINEKRYPEKVKGIEVRSRLSSVKKTVASSATTLSDFQPFIKLLPDLLGNPDKRDYFILFQNDAELRPTGGFMTAYATMSVEKGKIQSGVSEDIYTLDNAFKKKVPAPAPILKYLPLVYNWNLRDMNLSPDFKVSMDIFSEHYQQVPGAPESDAIIAIDTEVPVRILKVLGPIGVPGYGGQFSAENDPRCDCPQVIYELENIITKPTYEIREGRKSILGPLMNSMLANMMGSPRTKWPEFFTVFTDSIREKHLMMYFFDDDMQKAVEAMGAAGRIVAYEGGDYLHVNDTNFAGAKSNLFVEQEVEQAVTIAGDGSAKKKLTLTYKNPRKGDNCNLEAGQLCLNGLLRDWIRIYVPKGSTLQGGKGFEADMATSEDLGYTVLEGFFTLAPQSVKKLEVEYTTPAGTIDGDYKVFIQKQPGTDSVKHTITVDGKKPVVYPVNSDQEIVIAR